MAPKRKDDAEIAASATAAGDDSSRTGKRRRGQEQNQNEEPPRTRMQTRARGRSRGASPQKEEEHASARGRARGGRTRRTRKEKEMEQKEGYDEEERAGAEEAQPTKRRGRKQKGEKRTKQQREEMEEEISPKTTSKGDLSEPLIEEEESEGEGAEEEKGTEETEKIEEIEEAEEAVKEEEEEKPSKERRGKTERTETKPKEKEEEAEEAVKDEEEAAKEEEEEKPSKGQRGKKKRTETEPKKEEEAMQTLAAEPKAKRLRRGKPGESHPEAEPEHIKEVKGPKPTQWKGEEAEGEESTASQTLERKRDRPGKIDWTLHPEGKDHENYNEKVSQALGELGKNEKAAGEVYKANAYFRAARQLKACPYEVKSGEEASKFVGIGKAIAQKIDEILETGHISKLDKLSKDKRLQAIADFQKIHGIGPTKAAQLYDTYGIKSMEDLLKRAKEELEHGGIEKLKPAPGKRKRTFTKGGEEEEGEESEEEPMEEKSLFTRRMLIGVKYHKDLAEDIPDEDVDFTRQYLGDIGKKLDLGVEVRREEEESILDVVLWPTEGTDKKSAEALTKERPEFSALHAFPSGTGISDEDDTDAKALKAFVAMLEDSGFLAESLGFGTRRYRGMCKIPPEGYVKEHKRHKEAEKPSFKIPDLKEEPKVEDPFAKADFSEETKGEVKAAAKKQDVDVLSRQHPKARRIDIHSNLDDTLRTGFVTDPQGPDNIE